MTLPWKYPGFLTRILLPEALFFGNPAQNRVYLTFDDGPDPDVTPELLDILSEHQAQATFFVNRVEAEWWAPLVKRIAEGGHIIGLHGLRHQSGYLISNRQLLNDLQVLGDHLRESEVDALPWYRPPFGHIRPDTVGFLKRHGITTILWSDIPGDFRPTDEERLYRRALQGLKPGNIIVLHDGTRLRPAPVLNLTRRLLAECDLRDWTCHTLAF